MSYDHDNDRLYRRLLEAWNAHGEFTLEFSDPPPGFVSWGVDEDTVRHAVEARIREADLLVCLVGTHTHRSDWVAWEVGRAAAFGKAILAVKVDSANETPAFLIEAGARWAPSFTLDAIRRSGAGG